MPKTKNVGGRPRTLFTCEPAVSIVDHLGGIDAVSDYLGLAQSTVTKWGRPVADRGGGGRIPVMYWDKLIKWSRRRTIRTLTYADFMGTHAIA